MWIFPILLDSRPAFLGATSGSSLLLAPLGRTTVLKGLQERLKAVSSGPPVVMATFDADQAYESAIRQECPEVEAVESVSRFVDRCHHYEASDALLIADPTCLPCAADDPALAGLRSDDDPRWVRHLVAFHRTGGTREYVNADDSGRVRTIQRYYDSVTWSFAFGLSCSLIPVACLRAASLPRLESLPHLRRQLVSQEVPSRDLPLQHGAFNLATERGLIAANERMVLALERAAPASRGRGTPLHLGPGALVHPAATIVGPVVLQAGAEVEDGATVVGPAVIGPEARVRRGAVLAQSVVCRGEVVEGAAVLDRVVAGDFRAGEPAPSDDTLAPPTWDADPESLTGVWPDRRVTATLKRAFDVVAAGLGLVLLAPLGLLVAAIVKLESRGPVHFAHVREGRGGRTFRCWKFRTMVPGAHGQQRGLAGVNQVDGPQFKIERDPRRTRVGRLLTATNLDELPQLWNVLVGQMSLVGPRPSPFRENQLCVPWREARLSVRPGVTGLWQVCRHKRDQGDFHQWIYYDLLYVQNQSFWLDLKILAATFVSILGRGHVPLSWLLPAEAYGERRTTPREGPDARAHSRSANDRVATPVSSRR